MVSIFTTSPTKCLKVYNNMAASPSGKRVLICKSALPVNKLGENILLNNFIRFNCFSPHVSYSSCVPINASCVIVLIKFGHILLNNSLAVFDPYENNKLVILLLLLLPPSLVVAVVFWDWKLCNYEFSLWKTAPTECVNVFHTQRMCKCTDINSLFCFT